jgi:hypothetical protein
MHRKGACKPKGNLTAAQFITLEEALRSARMESCSVDPVHKAAMKLYLDSWVVRPLESVLESIRAKSKKRNAEAEGS